MRKLILFNLARDTNDESIRLRYELHTLIGPEMDIPRSVMESFQKNNQSVTHFIIDSQNRMNPHYDYKTDVFSFTANFGGMIYGVKIPGKYIVAIVDDLTGNVISFGQRQSDIVDNTPDEAPPSKPEQKDPGLRLVSSNPNVEKKKSKAILYVIKGGK